MRGALRNPQVRMRSSSNLTSTHDRRRSLNVSHYNALQNAVSNLSRIDDFFLEELGSGFFSDVFKVTHKQTGEVMVLKRNKNTNTKLNILREVQLMNRLDHPNILKFRGVCVDDGQLHGLTEFINGGNLDQLVTKSGCKLTWKERLQVALDISKGMQYLHGLGIFHRDLSSKNCLIRITTNTTTGKKRYKSIVADLGLAEKIPTNKHEASQLTVVGTPFIMAPEVLKGLPYNETADVFSFGLILCQLLALVSYDPEELPRSQNFGLAVDTFKLMLSTGVGKDPSNQPPPAEFVKLALDCCQMEPSQRPSFETISKSIQEIISKIKTRKPRASSFKVVDARSIRSRYGTPSSGNENLCKSTNRKSRRASSASRLSRSFSDISRELLAHAAVMASSNLSSDLNPLNELSNPFSALDHLNGGKMKIIDEPSLALLELTFDLATCGYTKPLTPNRGTNTIPRCRNRPMSLYAPPSLSSSTDKLAGTPPTSTSSNVRSLSHESCDPGSNCTSPDGGKNQDEDYQTALHRAMILSPRGINLAFWLCSRKTEDEKAERKSVASVMSVLSRNRSCIRRSISLPDISRIGSLFRSHHLLHQSDPTSRGRSHTGDEVFPSKLPPPEVAPTRHQVVKNEMKNSQHVSFSKESKVFFPAEEEKNDQVFSKPCSSLDQVSFSSSGSSSTGIVVSAGETTQKRRRNTPENNERTNFQHPPETSPACDHHKIKNRDSGYEEELHPPPPFESGNQHPVWSIAEDSPEVTSVYCSASKHNCNHNHNLTEWKETNLLLRQNT